MVFAFQLSGFNDKIIDTIFIGNENSHIVVASNSPLLRVYDCSDMNVKFVKGHTKDLLGLASHPGIKSIFASWYVYE